MERFDVYMERCLYGPDGFYTRHGTAGRGRGDFITSPEVGPLFGAVLANALDSWWQRSGRPERWTVYDVGCGPNTLLKSVRRARPGRQRPWRLIGVDRAASATMPKPKPENGIELIDRLPDNLENSVVVANELLDNLPFRIIDRSSDDVWSEIHIDEGEEVMVPTEVRLDIPPGTRAPLLERAGQWCRSVMERQVDHICLFDYGTATTAQLAGRGGWLRTYRRHQRGVDPLDQPGRWDITTDIALDQLPPGSTVATQARFLQKWGITGLVDEGRRYWHENASKPDLRAVAMRSRISEAAALTDPEALGSWLVAHYRKPYHVG